MEITNIPIQMEITNIPILDDLFVTFIEDMIKSLPSPSPERCIYRVERCIYRVPNPLRVINVKEYTPRLVSIGPFHHGEENLQAMEEHKLRYLGSFLHRTELRLDNCVDVVRTWEERARSCYAETIKQSIVEFVKIILVDGSFIVELVLRDFFPDYRDENDPILTNIWMANILPYDTMLLENQLPFFVLEGLFDLIPNFKPERRRSFLDLTREFLKKRLQILELPHTFSNSDKNHFVDLMHSCFLSSIPPIPPIPPKEIPPIPPGEIPPDEFEHHSKYDHPPTMTELHEAGIKFKKGEGPSLFDIKFTNGILEIPPLVVSSATESLLRNLLAFEQCHDTQRPIVSYAFLFDGFINTSKDVDLLTHDGILVLKEGSSEDISAMFNNICKNVVLVSPFYYSTLCEDLRAYCQKPYHRWKATLKRDYLNTPWKIVSIIVALVLLILTFLQAVCSVISL